MSYYDTLNRFRVKVSQSPKTITMVSVLRFKECPKNKIKAKLRKDGKISVTTDYEKYKVVKEKFGDLLSGAKNDSKITGNGGNANNGRNKASGTFGSDGGTKGKGLKSAISSILPGSGGNKPTEDNRGKDNADNLAKKSD